MTAHSCFTARCTVAALNGKVCYRLVNIADGQSVTPLHVHLICAGPISGGGVCEEAVAYAGNVN